VYMLGTSCLKDPPPMKKASKFNTRRLFRALRLKTIKS